jgi:polyhydroxyalkanoate synthase subunit PhaC
MSPLAPPSPADAVQWLRREVERNAIRARNGIKYVTGSRWLPPGPTPKDTVWRQGKVALWRYRSTSIRFRQPLLMFLGLVSRSSIFDLHERASFVARLRDAGFDVYVLDFGEPDAGDADRTISMYVSRYVPRAVRAAVRTSGVPDLTMIGYCMGGNLALMTLAGHLELPVRNLITMATPIDMTRMSPLLGPLRDGTQDPEALIDWTGCVPADSVYAMFSARKPTGDLLQYVNLWENLWNDEYVGPHQAITRWTRDHIPMPGAAYSEVVRSWLRENAFLTNRLRLDGRPIDLRSITVPTLAVITLRDEIVPPDAARPIKDLVGSEDFEMLELDAGHIGLTVSRTASQVTIPRIVDWLERHSDPTEA